MGLEDEGFDARMPLRKTLIMKDLEQFGVRAIVMPKTLLFDAVAKAVARPQNHQEALRNKEDLAQKIRAFTATSAQECREGSRILMPRDFVPQEVVDYAKLAGGPKVLGAVGIILTGLRTKVGDALSREGAEVMVEDGILTPADFTQDSPKTLIPESSWTRLSKSRDGAKISRTAAPIQIGKKPTHRFLQPETVYSLRGADHQLSERFGMQSVFHEKFYATTSKYEGGRKNMLDTLSDGITSDVIEKFMMDMMNAMEAIVFLHEQAMVHRDIKSENIFDGGVVFDNISIIQTSKLVAERWQIGTPFFIPEGYAVNWTAEKVSPYFRDIFAFAISIAEAISMGADDPKELTADEENLSNNKLVKFHDKYQKGARSNMTPEHFVKHLKYALFSGVKSEKLLRAQKVVEKMILGEGEYTLTDALRDLSAVFGSRM